MNRRLERRNRKAKEKAETRARMRVDIDPENYEYIPAEKETDYYDNDVNQRVGIYVRVSTDDVKQTTSFELQKMYYEDFVNKNCNPNVYYITRYGKVAPSEINFKNIDEDIFVMFGKESTGIPKEILKDHLEYCFRIPMIEGVRSLNLSNCVAIVVYEILRQRDYEGLSRVETIKGEDFLISN